MRTNNLIILVLFTLLAGSCKKYLQEKSDKSLVVPSTINDLQGLLDDVYFMNLGITPSMGESSSDDFFINSESYNGNNETQRNIYTWSVKELLFGNDWSSSYPVIYNANICLEQLANIPRTAQNAAGWDNVKGSALFYSAYFYLNLAWVYTKAYDPSTAESDLGIVIREGTDFNVKSVRSNLKRSYEKILLDAKESMIYLPIMPKNKLRPSLPAACGLLARAYLSMREYDSAYKYADLALSYNSSLINYNTIDINSNIPFSGFDNSETIFYTELNGYQAVYGNWQALVDTVLYNSYNNNDLRKQAFFFENLGYHGFKGMYTTNGYNFSGIATDELILTRAECLARVGKVADAFKDINELLVNRWNNIEMYTPVFIEDKDTAIDYILKERRKELLLRGLRWIDIKRLNKENRHIMLKRTIGNENFELLPNDDRYALPIPTDIIRLTGIQQNPA